LAVCEGVYLDPPAVLIPTPVSLLPTPSFRDKYLVRIGTAGTLADREPHRPRFRGRSPSSIWLRLGCLRSVAVKIRDMTPFIRPVEMKNTIPGISMTSREKITQELLKMLETAPEGIRFSVAHRRLVEALPDIPPNTISGTIWNIETKCADLYKPARGMFRHARFRAQDEVLPSSLPPKGKPKIAEEDFYSSFADYLVNELEECSKAMPVGGSKFRDKWGTPDVMGVLKARPSDILQFPTEIISAEVKIDDGGLITAFGQACSYRLFSHKTYIAVPESSKEDDVSRLESLSLLFGIGLILFDSSNPSSPRFSIRARATRHDPDMFYVNKVLREIADDLLG